MRAALRSEWTKVRTTPEAAVFLVLTVVLTVAVSVTAACFGGLDRVHVSLLGVQLGQAVVAAWGVQLLAGEFGSGLARATFAALPRRLTVLAAKAVLLLGGVMVAGAVSVGASVLAGALLIDGYPGVGAGGVLRASLGAVVYLPAVGLLGLGAAALVRSAVAGTGLVLGLLYLAPSILSFFANPDWQRFIYKAMPGSAGLSVLSTMDLKSLPISPIAGLGVAVARAFVICGVGAALVCARDV